MGKILSLHVFVKYLLYLFQNAKIRKYISDDHTVSILKEYDVIGMTVSGAATRLHLLGKYHLHYAFLR